MLVTRLDTREAEICSQLIGRLKSTSKEKPCYQERTRACWSEHFTKACQCAGFCQLVRSCLESPLSAAWRLGTSTASPTPYPLAVPSSNKELDAEHPSERSLRRDLFLREGLGRLPLPKVSAEAPEPGISAEGSPYPSGLGLGHCPGLFSGALHLQPAT